VARKTRGGGVLNAVSQNKDTEEADVDDPEHEVEVEDEHGNLFAAIVRKTRLKVKPGQRIGAAPKAAPRRPAREAGPEDTCHNCNEKGHFARDCPHPQKQRPGKGEGASNGGWKGAKGYGKMQPFAECQDVGKLVSRALQR